MTHVALAFEVPGGWLEERDATIMTVVQVYLMSGYLLKTIWPMLTSASQLHFLTYIHEYAIIFCRL